MLFMVNDSPYRSTALSTCLQVAAPGSAILLYEDGVYGAKQGSPLEETLRKAAKDVEIYVLEEDLRARGITKILTELKTVGYDGFVDLVVKHKVVPWL
ncbi:MAG: sulfurtransferase complex subunit TusB [Firmicutes bacterium]|nr:sulfurtransferase complex subunit TusB [Bacillota bacterium]